MNLASAAVNILWGSASLRARRAFRVALRNPLGAQRRVLFRHLADNRDTEFGRAHRFSSIRSVEE